MTEAEMAGAYLFEHVRTDHPTHIQGLKIDDLFVFHGTLLV
jgi:hypothetical protein